MSQWSGICSDVIALGSLPPSGTSQLSGTDAVSCRLGGSRYNSAALHQLDTLGKYPRETKTLFSHWQRLPHSPSSAFPQTCDLSPGSPEDVPACSASPTCWPCSSWGTWDVQSHPWDAVEKTLGSLGAYCLPHGLWLRLTIPMEMKA